jgi:hypothetical protein
MQSNPVVVYSNLIFWGANVITMWYEPQASNIQPWSKITTRSTDAIIFNMNLNEPKPS